MAQTIGRFPSATALGLCERFPSPADDEPDAGGLVEIEHELTRLLIEYDELETAAL